MNPFFMFIIAILFSLLLFPTTDSFSTLSEKWSERINEYHVMISTIKNSHPVPKPLKQLDQGVFPQDIICNPDLVLLLKWSENKGACVTLSTAKSLEKREWGILQPISSELAIQSIGCTAVWEVTFEDNREQNLKSVMKTMRIIMTDFLSDSQPWAYIEVEQVRGFYLFTTNDIFYESELNEITSSVDNLAIVENIKFSGSLCV